MKKFYILFIALFSLNIANAQDWKWLNPLPQGNNLWCITLLDANTGYAVGNGGAIIKTTNGGSNWTMQVSRTSKYLLSVYFINESTGYVVGEDGTILKTTDGGISWIMQVSGTSWWLHSIYFIDANTGFAVGSFGTILKTTNGGNLWTTLSSGTSSYLFSIYFTNAETGYVVGDYGSILKTTDGGGFPVNLDEQPSISKNLKIYPNPTDSRITLEPTCKGNLYIFNLSGQKLLQQTITAPTTIIDVSELPIGVYMVKLVGENDVQVGKVIKQ